MAALVAGNSLGLSNTSLHILGSAGKLGAAATGQAGEQVYVNAATGNLVVQNRDELVLGRGPDLNLVRTYNSRGLLNDDNGDNWRLGIYRRVFGLTGTANTAGSTVTRVDADGAESVYTFNATLGKYVCSEGEGAYDTLAFDSATQTWTFTDGDSRVTERYDWANNGRITQVQDADGNGLTYTYNASGLITQVSDASGETTFLDYTGTNLTQLRTVKSGGQTLVRTRYAYDASNRLIQVTTDLSPDDATVADGNVYTVNYTYDGTSKRIASLTQTDGNNLSFTYALVGGDWKVASYTDASGKTTSITYTQQDTSPATNATANDTVLSTTETQTTTTTVPPYYTVTSTDTWVTITQAVYGTSNANAVAALQAALGNPLPTLTQGLKLTVPQSIIYSGSATSATATAGALSTTLTSTVPPYYTVQAGNTWASIAQTVYGTSDPNAVAALQSTLNNPTLSTGLRLTVPQTLTYGGSTTAAANGAALSTTVTNSASYNLASGALTTPVLGWNSAAVLGSGAASATGAQTVFDQNGNGMSVWVVGADLFYSTYSKANDAWTAPATLDGTLAGNPTTPHLSMSANGNALVTWVQNDGAGLICVYARRFIAGAWDAAPTVLDTTPQPAINPVGAINDSGRAVVTFLQAVNVGINNLYASVHNGTAWQSATLVDNVGTGTNNGIAAGTVPSVAIDSLNNATVLWRRKTGAETADSLYFSRFNGSTWSAPNSTTLENTTTAVTAAKIVFDNNGNGVAIWLQGGSLLTKTYTRSTNSWSTTATTLGTTVTAPHLSMSANGNGLVTWIQGGNVMARRFAGGAWQGTAASTLENATGAVFNPVGSVNDAGQAAVVFVQTSGTVNNVYVNRFIGGAWSTAATLIEANANTVASTVTPSVAIDAQGNINTVWLQRNGTQTVDSVYSNRYNNSDTTPYYRVPSGATWSSIASTLYGSTAPATQLQAALSNPPLTAGNKLTGFPPTLTVTTTSTVAPYYTVQASDTWSSIAQTVYGDAAAAGPLQTALGNPTLTAGLRLTVPASVSFNPVAASRNGALLSTTDTQTTSHAINTAALTSAGGGQWTGPTSLTPLGVPASDARIQFDANGNGIGVWIQNSDVAARRFDRTSGAWESTVVLESGTGTVTPPELHVDASGNAIATWVQLNGSTYGVYARRYSAATNAWLGAAELLESTGLFAASVAAAANGSGQAVVVWAVGTNVRATRFTGSAWSAAVNIQAAANSNPASRPSVALDSAGNASVVWEQSDGTAESIYLNRHDNAANTWLGSFTLESGSSPVAWQGPQIQFDQSGNGIAAWAQGSSLFVRRYDKASNAWQPPVTLSSGANAVAGFHLHVDASGNAIVTWSESWLDVSLDVYLSNAYARRYSAAPASWSGADLLIGDAIYANGWTGAVNASGHAIVVYIDNDGTGFKAQAKRYTGSVWSEAIAIAGNTGNWQFRPAIALDAAGNASVAWDEFQPDFQTTGGIQVKRFNNAPASYTVQAGDTWTSIAQLLYGTSAVANALQQALGNPALTTGAQLTGFPPTLSVTSTITVAPYYTVQTSDTWTTITQAVYGTSEANALLALKDALGNPALGAGLKLTMPASIRYSTATPAGTTTVSANNTVLSTTLTETVAPYYTVQAGNTWTSITQAVYGTSHANAVAALQAALGNPALSAGLRLTVPQTISYTTSTSSTANSAVLSTTVTSTQTVTVAPYYNVQAGNTWTSITQAVYGTSNASAVAALQTATGNPTLTTGLHLTVPQTLSYNISVPTIVSADITGPLSQVTSLFYDGNGQIVRALTPTVGGTRLETRYAYDASGNVTQITDRKGNVVTYGYDANGNRTLERDAAGNTVTRTYGSKNELLTETVYLTPDPDGAGAGQPASPLTTRYVYDVENHPRFVASAEGRVTEYRYSSFGEQIAAIQYTGNLYSLAGLNPGDALTETQLNAWVGTADKAKSLRTDSTYDFRGQLATTKTYASVDAAGNGVVNGTEAVREYVYDQAGNLLKTVDPRGVATTAVLNDFTTTYVYDGLGRVMSTVDALGRSTLTQYQDANRKTVLTLANGLVSTSTYDATGNLVSVLQSSGGTSLGETKYFYDAAGRLRRTEDPTGIKTHILYDEAGRKIGEIDGDGSLTEYRYDAAGNLTRTLRYATAVSAANLASLIAADGKPTTVALAAIRPVSSAADRSAWNAYDTANRLVKSVDEAGAVSQYFYDGSGRLTDVVRFATVIATGTLGDTPAATSISPASNAADRLSRSFYDAEGRLRGSLDGEGYLVEYKYDAAGQLVETVGYATATPSASRATGTLAQLVPAASANDIRSNTLYNSRGQVAATVNAEGYLTETVYDLAGNKTQVIRYATKVTYTAGATLASLRPAANVQDRSSTFAYDALNRVTNETNPEGTQTQHFYDEVGNLVKTVKAANFSAEVRTLTAQYDKQGRLTAKLSAKGSAMLTGGQTQQQIDAIWAAHAIKHAYDAAGRRTSTTDANGKRTLFFYNADGALTHTINAAGEVKETVYNALGQVTQTIEYGTRISATTLATLSGGLNSTLTGVTANILLDSKTSYGYTLTGALAQKTDPLGNAVTQAFNAFGELAAKTQALGAGLTLEHNYAYDRRGLLTLTRWDPTGINTAEATVYDAFGRATQTTDARGNARTQGYDRLGRVVTSTDPLSGIRSTSYDAFDRVLTQTDALGKTTTYSYSTADRSITVRTPENITTITVKNRHGETVSITDGRGASTAYSYDANGNLTGIAAPAAGTVGNVYDSANRLKETTDALGTKTVFTYDDASRVLTRTVDSGAGRLNLVTTYAYDAKGQTVSVTDPAGVVTQTTFDLKGQVTQVAVDPTGLNLRTAYTYDGRGKTLTVTEGAGSAQPRVTEYGYDKLGRRTSERVDPTGINATTTYAYDKNDNVVRKTDARGNVTRYTYDANNRLVHTVDALGGVTKNDYDAEGRLVRRTAYATRISLAGLTDASTLTDIAGRVVVATGNDHTKGYVYDADGLEIYCVDSLGGVTQKIYDANGNVVREVRYFNAIPTSTALTQTAVNAAILPNAANDRVMRTVYDAANRAAYSVDAEGYVTERRFDLAGHEIKRIRYADRYTVGDGATVASMATLLPATVPATAAVEEARYDNAGRLFEAVDGMGNVTRNAYDAAGRKTDVTRAYGTSAASTTHYAYDAASRVLEETQGYGAAEAATTRYVLDAAGNRTKIIEARGVELAETDSTWALATRKALGYVDGVGNAKLTAALTSVEKDQLRARYTTTQQYDVLGRKTRTTDALGGVSVTDYDAFGNAVKITDPRGNSGYFYFDALNQAVLHVDPESYATQSFYDTFGNVERTVRYANKVTGTIGTGTPPAVTPNASRDQTTVNEYDKLGRNLKVTDAESYYEQYVYDTFGNKLSYRNQLGGVTTYTYDRVGNVLSETLPVGGIVNRFEYDARGNRTKQIEAFGLPESRTTTYEFDKLDREVKKIGQAVHVFDPVTFSTTGTGSPTEQKKYDARGNLIETIAAAGARTLTYYDALDRKVAEVGALGALTVWQYNDGKAPTAELRYGDAVALPAAAGGIPPGPVNAANVREKRFVYDANNALVETRVPSVLLGEQATGASAFASFTQDVVTKSVYDAAGNEVQAIDARGNSTFRYYDRLGQKILEVDPEKYLTGWQRDAAGNVIRETKYANKLSILPAVTSDPAALIANVGTNSADRVSELDYDRMNRVLERRVLNVEHGTVSGTGVLAPATGTARTQLRYNGLGQVTQQIDATGAVTDVGYDLAGRKTKEQSAQFTDFEGALVRPTTDYEYDALNQVKRELDRGKNNAVETDDRITTYQYDYGFGARLIGQTDPTGATVNFAYDLAGNIASRSRVRTNADSVSVTDRVNYSYDLLGRERLQKDIATSQTNETNYNVFGDLTGKRTNGGGLGAPWQEVAEYDKLGRVWKTNSGDGTFKVHLYDANGNSTLTIQSAGPDFSALTLDQVMALAGNQKFLTVSQYDARNKLVGTFQPKMNSSQEQLAIEQFITQTAGANFSSGAVSVGSMLQTTAKPKTNPVASGSVGVLKPGAVSASVTLRFTPGNVYWIFYSADGTLMTFARAYTNPNHSLSLTLPDTSALGPGNVRIAFSLAGVPGSGGNQPYIGAGYWEQVNDYWESNLAGYSNSFFAPVGTLNPTFSFGEFTTDGAAPRVAAPTIASDEPVIYQSLAYQAAYYGPYSQGLTGRAYSYSLYKQTDNGEIFLGSFNGRTQPASAPNSTEISSASWNSGVGGVTGREVDFRAQPGSQQLPANRLILQSRPTGSAGGWTVTSVSQKVINGAVAPGWFAFDWTSWAQGSYEVRYTTLDAAGNVTNSQSGTMVLSDSVPSFTQTTQQIGGVGRAFMASDGVLHLLEQGTSAQTLTLRYRHAGSSEAWSTVNLGAANISGAVTPGWFMFNPAAYGMTGSYEYWIEAKNAAGAQVNKALGTFTVGTANSVSALTAYQDLPEVVHFLSQPASATSMKLSYRANGSTGAYTTIWATKVGTGAFDWDATSLVVDRLANYDYEYQYETFDAANALVNKAHGVLRLGASPAMLSHLNDGTPSIVSFSPPQTNATKLVLNYRNASSTGAYTPVTLTRANSGQPFTWDAASLGTVTLDYYYELFDSLNAPVRSADGNAVRVDGTLTLGATSEPSALKWVIVGSSNQEWSIHRTQAHNAFGEVAQEIDGLGRITDFTYSKLGQLTEKRSPETDISLANGFIQRGRPTTRYAYDLAGRLVAVTDANGNVNTLQLLAGSDVNGEGAQALTEFHADGGRKLSAYDVFGDARTLTDEIGRVTRQEYDKLGRLIRVVRPARGANTPGNETAAAVSGIDSFTYDQIGNRITRTNAQSAVEKTYYDSLGRVVQNTSFSGDVTGYSYNYDAAILGAGAVQVGGWLKTITDGTGRALRDKQDVFGRTTWHQDLGDHQFTYSYNHAGWLTSQTGTSGQNIVYDYYANGYIKSIDDRATGALTKYEYDAEGNRTLETFSRDLGGGSREFYQSAQVTYDELNRVKRVLDPKADIRYEYDANSNRRRVWSYYHDGVDGSPRVQEYWYAYDAMNRFVVTMGQLSSGGARGASATDSTVSVVKGSTGVDLQYNAASERKVAIYGSDGHREDYTYTADGYLEDTTINGVLRARRYNDSLGRTVKYQEYGAAGAPSSGRASSYDADSKLVSQTEYNGAIGGTVASTTTYDYLDAAGTNNNAGPLASTVNTASGTTLTTLYTYEWWDTARDLAIKVLPQNAQAPGWREGFSHFQYDVNGHLKQVDDVMGGRAIRFTTDAEGLVLIRDELSGGTANAQGQVFNASTIDKHHAFYYLDGHRIGDVGNDGPLKISYAEALARPRGVTLKDSYKNWRPISSADFDQNYEPIGPSYPAATPGVYTVRTGDTLRGIALAVWGDADLWYILADANGLSGSTALVAGQTLTIPNKVTNIHNNSSTYRVYNAGEAIGDTSPTLPEAPPPPPPPRKKGCGGFGKLLAIVVLVVATIFTAGAATAGLSAPLGTIMSTGATTLMGGFSATALAAGAVGSMASQAVAMATGAQDAFSWKGVATTAFGTWVAAGMGPALSSTSLVAGMPAWAQVATTAAAASTVTQGANMALGLQQKFDWRSVAASAVVAPIGAYAGAAAGSVGGPIAERMARGLVGQAAQKAVGIRDDFDYAAAAGNAIGESLADELGYDPLTAEDVASGRSWGQSLAAFEQARMSQTNDDAALGRAPQRSYGSDARAVIRTFDDTSTTAPSDYEPIEVAAWGGGVRLPRRAGAADGIGFQEDIWKRRTDLYTANPLLAEAHSSEAMEKLAQIDDLVREGRGTLSRAQLYRELAEKLNQYEGNTQRFLLVGMDAYARESNGQSIFRGRGEAAAADAAVRYATDQAKHSGAIPETSWSESQFRPGADIGMSGIFGAAFARMRLADAVVVNAASSAAVLDSFVGPRIGRSGLTSTDEFAEASYLRYQQYVTDAYDAAIVAESKGLLKGNPATRVGAATDRDSAARYRRWLVSEGITEGPGTLIQMNRWLLDPSGSGLYVRPDIRIPNARVTLDATIGMKWGTDIQIMRFSQFSVGDRITVVRPQQLGGSYSIWP